MMSDVVKLRLTNELEAAREGLKQKVREHQHNLTRLAQMVNDPEASDPYQMSVWTGGQAAHEVAEIGSLLMRVRTLEESLYYLSRAEE